MSLGGDRVQVEGLGKRYDLGERNDLREALAALRQVRSPRRHVWSLRDVSFTVPEGGALGVVGRNGAGKSTLLKILMRITSPTEGRSRTRGRVAALLEVGTGFHPELTGRDNVYLNAAILGMTRAETTRRFDQIVDFSGTERFLDTPVKRYSSGMYLRLAFAVAAHLEPDVLIVDEVLAVGDAEFQRKCLGRMSEAEREGRTIIFVSHDLVSLRRLCPRAIWLEQGRVRDDGPTEQVVRDYLTSGFAPVEVASRTHPGDCPVRLLGVEVVPVYGAEGVALLRDDPLRIRVRLQVLEERPGLDVALYVTTSRGVRVLDELLGDEALPRLPAGVHVIELDVPAVLNVGEHSVGVWVGTAYEQLIDEAGVASFHLHGEDEGRPDRAVVLHLPFRVSSA